MHDLLPTMDRRWIERERFILFFIDQIALPKETLQLRKGGERHNAVVQCKGHSCECILVN